MPDEDHGSSSFSWSDPGTQNEEGPLLARIAGGDLSAFEALMTLHQDGVLRAARRIVRDDSEAEDITQEAFLRLWRMAGSFKSTGGGAGGWLRQVARNLAIDRIRKSGRIVEFTPEHEPVAAPEQELGLDQRETAVEVDRALAALPERQRLALVLFHYEGLSMAEVADQLVTSAEAVESLLARARRTLRVELKGTWQALMD